MEMQAREKGKVVARVSEDQTSVEEVLKKFRDDLAGQGFNLEKFDKSYQKFRQLRSEAKKALSQWEEKREEGIAQAAGRITGKSAAVIARLFSPSRVAVELLGGEEKLEQTMADAFGYFVRVFKSQEDQEFLKNPLLHLTRGFVEDLNAVCEEKGVMLFFDTYEYLSQFGDEWLCKTFLKQPLSGWFMLIFAGREEFSSR
jgi:hypothetical protein